MLQNESFTKKLQLNKQKRFIEFRYILIIEYIEDENDSFMCKQTQKTY